MSDIVERLNKFVDLHGGLTPESHAMADAADEIETLRKRVKELEAINSTLVDKANSYIIESGKLANELAALKQGQGEPVAHVTFEKGLTYTGSALPVGTKLYTPTIPAGWQLMDMDWLKRKLDYIFMAAYPVKRRNEIEKEVDLLLAAAPKLYTSAPTIPEDEIDAVRMFLMYYGSNRGVTVNAMRENMTSSGFDGGWPAWVEEAENQEHLTKAGAQSWLRHLFITK